MNTRIKKIYDEANKLGMKPFMFDQCVTQFDVFDRQGTRITNINHKKFMSVARTILKERKNVQPN